MAGITSVSGLMSGIKTDELITQIMDLERRPIKQYEAQQSALQTKLAAYQEVNTRLGALRDAADTVARSSFFNSRLATVSHESVAAATAELGATPGEYSITVESVARAHQVRSQSYSDLNAPVLGTGTLTITAGGRTTEIVVDSSNNTLAGLRTAINNANSNIRASIIQDGESSYRLLISSKETGTANALTLGGSLAGGTAPVFQDLRAAADARVVLGSGATAITVERSTNQVRDLIPGVRLDLLSASPGTPVTVTVDQDRATIVEGVKKLVDQYNQAIDFINSQFQFDSEKSVGGALLGDYTLRNAQADLLEVFGRSVPGLSGVTLADVGVTTRADGKLALNADVLQEKLQSDPDSVMRIFSLNAKTTHAAVLFLSAGPDTVADGTAYSVQVTQAARQASVTAGAAHAAALAADETLTVNGVSITLTAGMSLADVVTAVNARSKDTGVRAAATGADGTGAGSHLTFTTASYGSRAAVSVTSSRSLAGGDSTGVGNVQVTQASGSGESGAGVALAGLDVMGTLNGEPATGAGQTLRADRDNATTAGLSLRITGTATGALGTVTLYRGLASGASQVLERITDTSDGPIAGEEDSLQQRIDDLQKLMDERSEAIKRKEQPLRLKFYRLEQALAEFQGQSAYLTSQFSSTKK